MPSTEPKKIDCPQCTGPMTLDGFAVEEHADGTWTAEPSIICPHDYAANFFVTHGVIEWITR